MKRTVSVAFSPNGQILASGGPGSTIKLWDLRARKELKTLSTQFFEVVSSVAFSPDGKTLASGYESGTIRLWDIASGKELNSSLMAVA
ncbi:MAG: (Myosin heavy-chain) kinase [Acidobacteria bacterium]|jgi:WD40 repeat protein|nr:(Myosin heavy-chain) kinase [Acidobacteriota bacterium]